MIKRALAVSASMALLVGSLVNTGCEPFGGGGGGGSPDIGDNNPDIYLAIGDSITRGFGLPGGSDYPSVLSARIGKTVLNSGRNGDLSSGVAARLPGDLAGFKPSYVLIMAGFNDINEGISIGAIVANIRSAVQACKANKSVPVVGLVTPVFGPEAFLSGSVMSLNQELRAMASQEGARVADTFGAITGADQMQADGLHPNSAGAAAIAGAFSRHL